MLGHLSWLNFVKLKHIDVPHDELAIAKVTAGLVGERIQIINFNYSPQLKGGLNTSLFCIWGRSGVSGNDIWEFGDRNGNG